MTMTYETVLTSLKDGVLTLTINRPDKLNALNAKTIEELHEALLDAENDNQVKVLIITGTGEKAFVAGADIAEFANFSVQQGKNLSATGHFKIFNFIENYSKPVIAAINGFALGGGLELAMACHIRVAAEGAKLGLPEVSLGLIPGYGGTQRLAQLVGKAKAFEMICTGDFISADEALRWGLVNHVCSLDQLSIKANEIATRINLRSPSAVRTAIKVVNSGFNKNENGFEVEIEEFGKLFSTNDFKEGVDAFMNKRKPAFTGN